MRCAPMASESVTVGSRPSGTSATVTPTAKRNPSVAGVPMSSAKAKNARPTPTASLLTVRTIRSSSRASGVADRLCSVVRCARPARRRARSRGVDDGGRLPLDDEGAGVEAIALGEPCGDALAREHRRVHGQAVHAHGREIGRDPVPRRQQHAVAHHQLGGVDLERDALAHHRRPPGQQVAEAFGRGVGAVLLDPGEHAVHDHDGEDRDPELRHAGHDRQDPRHPQHAGEEVRHLVQERPPRRGAGGDGQDVGAVDLQPTRGLGRREAPVGARARRPFGRGPLGARG